MAIKDIIARGIGFSPGSVKFVVTYGFVTVIIVMSTKSLTAEDADVSLTAEDAGISLDGEDTGETLIGKSDTGA